MSVQTRTASRICRIMNAMTRNGLAINEPLILDGEFHRFHTPEDIALDKPSTGWYVIDPGASSASFGSHRGSTKFHWRPGSGSQDEDLTEQEEAELRAELEAVKQEKERKSIQRAKTQTSAAQAARNLIKASRPANSGHPYLSKKGIEGKGALQRGPNLIIPIQNQDKEIINAQIIFNDGNKRFLTGGAKKGGYHAIGGATETIYIAEGYATASSVHAATGSHSIVAFDAGNLLPVSGIINELHPESTIIICADNDQWGSENTGINKARTAAEETGASVVYPTFRDTHSQPTDFNDLHSAEGIEEVKSQLSSTTYTQINQRYIQSIPSIEGVICIKSAKDTGKTYALEEVIERNRAANRPTLIVTHRISLSRNISERLRISNYQDFKSPDNLQQEDFLIVCADSLHKLGTKKFNTVILDESEQIIRHFTSKSMKNQIRNLNGLYFLIHNAATVIAMDADLSPLTTELPPLQGSSATHAVINSYKPNSMRPLRIQPTEAQLLSSINNSVSNDEAIWVSSSSRAAAERIFHLLQEEHPHKRGLLITSKTHNNDGTTAFMANPNSECKKYDYIIASPSAGTGVSVDIQGRVDHVYGIFRAQPITHTDALQALSRVREKVPVTVWVEKRRLSSPESPEEVRETYLDAMEHAENLVGLKMDGTTYSISPEYESLHCEVVAHENRSRNHFFDNFIRQAENEGYAIQQIEEDYAETEQGKLLRKEGKELARNSFEEAIINAKNISDNIHEKLLDASDDIKQENDNILKRAQLSRFYGIENPSDEDVKRLLELDNQGKLQHSIKQLETIAISKEEAVAIDHKRMTNPDRFRHKIRPITPIHEVMTPILGFVGITYDERTKIFNHEEREWTQHHIPAKLVRHIEDHKSEIDEFLNHRVPADFEGNPIRFIHTLLSAFGLIRSKSKRQIDATQGPDHLFNNNKEIPLDPARRVFHYKIDTARLNFLNSAILHRRRSRAAYHWKMLAEMGGDRV